MLLAHGIKTHGDGEARLLPVVQTDVQDSIPKLGRVNLILVRRFNLHVCDLLETTVVRDGYPQLDSLCACRNLFDRCLVFELEFPLARSGSAD